MSRLVLIEPIDWVELKVLTGAGFSLKIKNEALILHLILRTVFQVKMV